MTVGGSTLRSKQDQRQIPDGRARNPLLRASARRQ